MPYLVLLMSVVTVVVVGTSSPTTLSVAVGGDQTTQLRYFDEPFITNFNPPEPEEWPTSEQPRRWSKSNWRISWPNAGLGWWISHISVNTTPRPPDAPAQIEFSSPHISGVVLPNAIRHLQILTRSTDETPLIAARMTPLSIKGDNRDLGIVITHIGITSLGRTIRVQLMLALLACFVMVSLVSRILVPQFSWMGLLIINLLIISTVHTYAEWWLVHTHTLLISSLIGISLLAVPLCKKSSTISILTLSVIASVVVAQLLLINSPWLRSSDISMHVRMLNQVMRGELLFTAQLPCEAGGQMAPYPIISYLLATPLALWSTERWWHIAVLQSGAIIAHAIAVFYASTVLIQHRLSTRQLLFWVGFAITSPFLMRAIHIGEMSNAWAHALYIIAVLSWFDQRADWRIRWLLGFVVVLTHTGITITYLATMATYVAWQWYTEKKFPLQTLLVIGASVSLGGALYYSQFIATVFNSVSIPGCPPNYPIAVRFSTIGDGWVWPLIISALGGLGLSTSHTVRRIIVVGIGAAVVALVLLLIRDQTVRWALALVPFIALSASLWLGYIAQKQRAGRIFALSAFMLGVWMIYHERWEQLFRYLHD
jgi:hypothetical protein